METLQDEQLPHCKLNNDLSNGQPKQNLECKIQPIRMLRHIGL